MATSRGLFRRQQARPTLSRELDQNEIARVAYELYQQRGGINGHDLEDWLNAEQIVRLRTSLM